MNMAGRDINLLFSSFLFVLCMTMMAAVVEEEETIEYRAADNVLFYNTHGQLRWLLWNLVQSKAALSGGGELLMRDETVLVFWRFCIETVTDWRKMLLLVEYREYIAKGIAYRM